MKGNGVYPVTLEQNPVERLKENADFNQLAFYAQPDSNHSEADADLRNAFGKVNLDVQLQVRILTSNGVGAVSGIGVRGRIVDLYDSDLDFEKRDRISTLADMLTILQAGFGTLGRAGEVFRSEVQLDADDIELLKDN